MKTFRSRCLVAVVLALLGSTAAFADDFRMHDGRHAAERQRGDVRRFDRDHDRFSGHFRGNVGVYIGTPPIWWPGYDLYIPPPRSNYSLPQPTTGYLYCPDPPGYYPQVVSCDTEWQVVVPARPDDWNNW